MGLAYQQLKQYPEAIESLAKALKLRPDLYESMFNLGMAYAAVGDTAGQGVFTAFCERRAGSG